MAQAYNYLIISALGMNNSNIISELSRACVQCGCNVLNTKINVLGQDLAAFLFLSGNWGAIAKMEATLPSLEQRLSLSIQSRRTHESVTAQSIMTYSIQVIAIDRTGILNELSDFLQKHSVLVEEVCAQTYINHASTKMVSLQLKIQVPGNVHLATLREKFMSYCDDNNFEGFLDPIRNA
jgi:glycine cleavage system transcriptional repressor